ncbi:PASTA domain-containing protein [Mycolicibacterium septicum]|uniref:PASTA domain-containing protein n=1 Tax=Mycolicibacterium septicum TaxID=98668 RepID=UPI0023E2975D|nr:PASTA domain-containing protein [Mycolicibacterium septicum]MDF3337157.1 PASTA domain-containing protein [Mycolicibacterium septicum]
MRKLLAAAMVLGASAVPIGALATGVAAADDYAGQKYSDAQSALADAGMKGVVATRSGDSEADDDCVVTSSEKAPWLKGDNFAPVTDTVLLNLNCSAGVASAKTPGNSAASPEGRAAIAAAKQQAEEEQQQAEADQAKTKH